MGSSPTSGTSENSCKINSFVYPLLASHPGWVYSRGQIMATVWGTDFSGDSRAADMQIRNIREKIEPEPKNPRYVLTARGMGYKFAEI